MKAKRYFINHLPIAHINGKMAQVAYTVSDIPPGGSVPDTSFWYGYRRKSSPTISRYGIRSKHRMLEDNPYSGAEIENRTIFIHAVTAVDTNFLNPTHKTLCELDFYQQKDYRTLRGYATAVCYQNGGNWPEQWTE